MENQLLNRAVSKLVASLQEEKQKLKVALICLACFNRKQNGSLGVLNNERIIILDLT